MTIWDVAGNIVFDSGSQLAKYLAKESPETFNSQGLPDSFDNRSDDKGTEPEAVTVARSGGATTPSVGLERAGGAVIFDITFPARAGIIGYVNNTNPDG